MKLKMAVFPNPVWGWDLVVFHGGTFAEVMLYVEKFIGISCEYTTEALGHCWIDNGKPLAIWIHDLKDIPTLVHELMHATFGMLGRRGLSHSGDSEEAYTYTLQHILTRVLAAKKWATVKLP